MEYTKALNELLDWKKESLCNLIEFLMEKGKLDITDINLCYTRALESKIAEKDKIIFDADTLLFESMFTDSIGKPADNNAMLRKLEWLSDRGTHNIEGIMDYLTKSKKSK